MIIMGIVWIVSWLICAWFYIFDQQVEEITMGDIWACLIVGPLFALGLLFDSQLVVWRKKKK
jgi:hypothetical protein